MARIKESQMKCFSFDITNRQGKVKVVPSKIKELPTITNPPHFPWTSLYLRDMNFSRNAPRLEPICYGDIRTPDVKLPFSQTQHAAQHVAGVNTYQH